MENISCLFSSFLFKIDAKTNLNDVIKYIVTHNHGKRKWIYLLTSLINQLLNQYDYELMRQAKIAYNSVHITI